MRGQAEETASVALDAVNLADAMRITGRPDSTIKGWIAASASLPPDGGSPSPRYFRRGEVTTLDAVQGSGQPYRIEVAALRRVHFARGGTDWHPDAAQAHRRASPQVAQELARLRAQVHVLSAELADARAQVEYWRGRALAHQTPYRAGATRAAVGATDTTIAQDGDAASAGDSGAPVPTPPPLPDGYVSVASVARRHGLGAAGARSLWRGNRHFMGSVRRGVWHHRGQTLELALDEDGQRAFGRLLGGGSRFRACGQAACVICAAAEDAGHHPPVAEDATS